MHIRIFGLATILLIGCSASVSTSDPSTPASQPTPTSTSATATDPAAPATPPAAPTDPYADMPQLPESDSGQLQLTSPDVSSIVNAYYKHIQKVCWNHRASEDTTKEVSVRVEIQVEVLANGSIKSVKGSGGEPYDGLAKCAEDHVRRWRFPKAELNSILTFPILFTRE